MRLVFAGTPEVALPALRALVNSRHTVAAVVTRPDAPAGRGRRLVASPVAELAAELGIEALKPDRPREPSFLDRLRAIAPDCCPVVAYGALLPQSALDIPVHGWVNLHFSVLPAWRGAAPVQHAVLRGDDITGASTFQIVKELDAGPVYGTLTEPVRPADTSGDLLDRLSVAGAELLVATLDGIEDGTVLAVPQPADGISFAPKLSPDDARVDWKMPAHLIDRQIRGCTPDPGAWTDFESTRLKLWPVTLTRPPAPVASALASSALGASGAAVDAVADGAASAASPRASSGSSEPPSTSAPAPSRSGSATSSRRASAGCPPRTGRAACTPTPPSPSGSADMGVYRRPRPRHRPAAGPGTAGAGPARDADAAKRDVARRSGNPRRAAYQVLAAVENREAYANLLLPKLLADRDITGRDAALATELAYGTLRGQGTYDAVLAACSDRPLDKLDPPVRQILRLGAHQLLATRIGAHAAVATSVDLAKQVVGPRVSGYVNAVLRRVATRDLDAWLAIVAPDPATDADGNLAVRYSYPRWIVAAYRAALGDAADAELEAALAEGNARPKVTMATLPGGPDRDQVMPADAEPGRWSPYAFTLDSGNPADLIASGRAAVQDEASQLAAIALTRAPLAPAAANAAAATPGPANAGSTCARAPAASPACCTAWPRLPPRPPAWSRPSSTRTAPPSCRETLSRAGPPGRRRRGHRRRRHQAAVARRQLRPGAGRRALLGARRAPPPSRGALAEGRVRPRGPDRAAARAAALGPRGGPPRRRGRVRDLLSGPGRNPGRGHRRRRRRPGRGDPRRAGGPGGRPRHGLSRPAVRAAVAAPPRHRRDLHRAPAAPPAEPS